ncbi:MAG: sodium-dependent transporter, partial [Bacillota bacterium]
NGGAAFIIVYLLSTLLVGLPVMITELIIGRRARANAIGSLQSLEPRQPWYLVGVAGVLSAFLILGFYTEVAGWVFAYIFKAAGGVLSSTKPDVTSRAFASMITDPMQSLVWQWIVLVFISLIIIAGVSRGIEAMTKRLMPCLFLLLVLVCARSLTLPGATEGLRFLFRADFSKVTGATILTAMGLSFFKLSVGMGTMITYGSYSRDDQNIPATAVRVMLADVGVSVLAGLAIFPAVFAFGFEPGAGPQLLFITIPAVFSSMPFGRVFMVMFFVLSAIAATGAMLSLLEVPVAYISERYGWSRTASTLVTLAGLVSLGSTAALSNSIMAEFKPFGMTMFDLLDYSTSNILLPVGGLFLCLFAGWRWGLANIRAAASNEGCLNNRVIVNAFYTVVRFVTPALVFVVLLNGLGIVKL